MQTGTRHKALCLVPTTPRLLDVPNSSANSGALFSFCLFLVALVFFFEEAGDCFKVHSSALVWLQHIFNCTS